MSTMTTPFSLRLALAEGLVDRGDHLGAAAAYAELVAEAGREDLGHGTTALRTALALAYFRSAQLGRAEAVLRELVAEGPDDGYLHLLLGRTLQRQRRHDEARRHLALAAVLGDHEGPTAYGEASGASAADRA
jgi:Flp pilus assembly protein TadD